VPTSPRTPDDLGEFRSILSKAVYGAATVREIEGWLEAQPYVSSVRIEPYLLKSFPPQRRFIVELSLPGTPRAPLAIDVYTFDDARFELREVHAE
jgi:hypothetical protein